MGTAITCSTSASASIFRKRSTTRSPNYGTSTSRICTCGTMSTMSAAVCRRTPGCGRTSTRGVGRAASTSPSPSNLQYSVRSTPCLVSRPRAWRRLAVRDEGTGVTVALAASWRSLRLRHHVPTTSIQQKGNSCTNGNANLFEPVVVVGVVVVCCCVLLCVVVCCCVLLCVVVCCCVLLCVVFRGGGSSLIIFHRCSSFFSFLIFFFYFVFPFFIFFFFKFFQSSEQTPKPAKNRPEVPIVKKDEFFL